MGLQPHSPTLSAPYGHNLAMWFAFHTRNVGYCTSVVLYDYHTYVLLYSTYINCQPDILPIRIYLSLLR